MCIFSVCRSFYFSATSSEKLWCWFCRKTIFFVCWYVSFSSCDLRSRPRWTFTSFVNIDHCACVLLLTKFGVWTLRGTLRGLVIDWAYWLKITSSWVFVTWFWYFLKTSCMSISRDTLRCQVFLWYLPYPVASHLAWMRSLADWSNQTN